MIFRLDKRELWNPNCVFYLHFLFFLFSIARITVVCGCYTTRCDASLFPLPVGYIVRCLLVVFSSFVLFLFLCLFLDIQLSPPRKRGSYILCTGLLVDLLTRRHTTPKFTCLYDLVCIIV